MVGLQRICRVLGVDQETATDQSVNSTADEILGSTLPGVHPTALEWEGWLNFVRELRTIDKKLGRKYQVASQIADSFAQTRELAIGSWIWWPHTEGRIAVVVALQSSYIEVAYEPTRIKKLSPNYVMPLDVSPP